MGVQSEQMLDVQRLIVCTDGGTGNTTLTGDHAETATTLNLGSSTGLTTGNAFRVGSDEDQEVYVVATVPNGTSVTIAAPGLKRAHKSGEPVVEQVADEYGPVTDAGVRLRITREALKQFIASQRLSWTILNGYGAGGIQASLSALTLENIALTLGIPRSRVLGAGTAADWKSLINAGGDFGTVRNVNIIAEGRLNDLTPIRAELYGCAFTYTGLQFQLARGVLATPQLNALAGGGVILDKSASPWTGTTTYVGTNAQVLDGLDDFGYFVDHATPGATTVASGGAINTNTVTVADGSAYQAGDWAQFDVGNRVEFHQVHTSAANVLTLRSRFLRAQVAGAAVKRVVQTQLSSITTDGVTMAFGGTQTEVRSGLRALAVGLRNGNADVDVSFALTAWTLRSWAIATGRPIPTGDYLSFLTGLGQTPIAGLYATGLLQSGQRMWFNSWGVRPDLSALEATMSNAGDAPAVPCRGTLTSGFHLAVHP